MREDVLCVSVSHFRRCASRSRHPAGSAAPPRRECSPSTTPQHHSRRRAGRESRQNTRSPRYGFTGARQEVGKFRGESITTLRYGSRDAVH